ncbi:MAG: hypothetical protein DME22_07625 [Verrucomicrobia bacterium]|nr:MAG: hypothetical protein DME22_07625 [Verrucomicrobiota bacterium]
MKSYRRYDRPNVHSGNRNSTAKVARLLLPWRTLCRTAAPVFFIASFFCAAPLFPARAYTFIAEPPYTWPDGNVSMVLKLGSAGRNLLDGNTSWDEVARQALSTWNPYVGAIQFAPTTQSPGVGSDGDQLNQAFFSSTVYGRGPLRWSGGQLLCDLRRVALHEFGHVLGLAHPDQAGQTVSAIMNSIISDLDALAYDDITGAEALYPLQAPIITTEPQSQTALAGSTVTFSVVVSGSEPLSYQWRLNGVNIPGATSASYTISNAQPTQAGDYTVVVSNAAETITSAAALLTVNAPPSITSQPQSQVTTAGNSVMFSVGADGTAPFTYQWYRSNSSIAGATAASYTIGAAKASDAGGYKVRVSNSAGSVDSVVATLTVQYPPVITAQPQSLAVNIGATGTFTVVASGIPDPTYQWEFNGVSIPGATSSSFTRDNVQPADAGNYTVVASNSAGAVTSQVAVLGVNQPLSITLTAPTNGAVLLSVSGPAVKNLTIYASPDLLNWLPIVTKTNAQGTLQYTDTAAGSFTRRFYKATAE